MIGTSCSDNSTARLLVLSESRATYDSVICYMVASFGRHKLAFKSSTGVFTRVHGQIFSNQNSYKSVWKYLLWAATTADQIDQKAVAGLQKD